MFARHFGMPGKGNLKDLGRSDVSQVLVSEFRQFTVACVATSVVLVLLYLSQQVPADIKAWTTDDRPGVHITAFYILMMVLDQVCAVLLAFYGCAWLLSLKLAAILCSDYVICITSELGTPRVLAHAERENSVWNMRVKRHLQRLVENDFEILLDWASSLGAFGVYISYRCMHTFMSAGMHGRLWHKTYRFTVASSLWANILAMAYVAYIPARFTTECKRMHYALNHLLVRYMIVPNSANVHQILYPCWHAIDQLNMGQGPGFAVVTFTSSIHTNRHMGTVITTHMIFTAVCKFMGAFFLLYAFGARNWNQQLTSNLPETCTLAFEHSIGMFCCGNNMSTA